MIKKNIELAKMARSSYKEGDGLEMMTAIEVCKYRKYSHSTLQRQVREGLEPPPINIRSSVLWIKKELDMMEDLTLFFMGVKEWFQ